MVLHKVLPTLKGLIIKGNSVLLLRKKPTAYHKDGMYDLPGGHICFGENIAGCLQRTIKEDVNLLVEISKPINAWTVIKDNKVELVGTTFLCKYKGISAMPNNSKQKSATFLNLFSIISIRKSPRRCVI